MCIREVTLILENGIGRRIGDDRLYNIRFTISRNQCLAKCLFGRPEMLSGEGFGDNQLVVVLQRVLVYHTRYYLGWKHVEEPFIHELELGKSYIPITMQKSRTVIRIKYRDRFYFGKCLL